MKTIAIVFTLTAIAGTAQAGQVRRPFSEYNMSSISPGRHRHIDITTQPNSGRFNATNYVPISNVSYSAIISLVNYPAAAKKSRFYAGSCDKLFPRLHANTMIDTIKIKGVDFTKEELIELYEELKSLFGENKMPLPHYPFQPLPSPPYRTPEYTWKVDCFSDCSGATTRW